MDQKKKEDIEYQAAKDAANKAYNPPNNGAFGLRSTVVGSGYSEDEKAERRHYDRVYRDNK